jgi:thymidylate synthase|tara:strand:+ start:1117 stop:2076 length:960 start_codon:yes stop_codon:yes gene_type:complete
MANVDEHFLALEREILARGFKYEDPNRKGINRIQIPTYTFKHNFKDGFPAITTKKLFFKGVVGELIWFLRGDTNIKYLHDNSIHIWDKDAANFSSKGDLGRIYGAQWRDWRTPYIYEGDEFTSTDQIGRLLKNLISNPMGTQHIVTAWNPAELENMALPPCHWSFEILVQPLSQIESEEYSCESKKDVPIYGFTLKWHQRSVDTFLGLPFNIASYAVLAHLIAEITGMASLAIEGDLSNVHLYEPHLDAVKEQMSRSTKLYNSRTDLILSEKIKTLCALYSKGDILLDELFSKMDINDISLTPYTSHPSLQAKMFARDN